MVPEWFWQIMDEVQLFHERGINVTLKPQSNPNATFVVEGYTDEMLEMLHNGMPQRGFTEAKNKHVTRPKPTFIKAPDPIYWEENDGVPQQFSSRSLKIVRISHGLWIKQNVLMHLILTTF